MKEEESLRQSHSLINQEERLFEESLSSIVSKSFHTSNPKQNKLLFLTKSLPITRALAISFLESVPDYNRLHDMTLLIDFASEQIECINEHLAELILLEPKKKYFSEEFGQIHVLRLTPLNIDKRRGHYIKGGIFGLTCQVFLTDLLRGEKTIDPKRIGTIIIKMGEKVRDHYHYYAWLSTYLKVQQKRSQDAWTIPIIYISNHPQYYADIKEMQRIYRTFFCKKIVVWPFYRAEITKRLSSYRKKNKSKEWEHEMSHSEKEKELFQALMKLYYFLKKGLTSKYKDKIFNIQEILYGNVAEDGFKATRSQFTELQNIKYLLSQLDNSNHIRMAKTIASFIDDDNCDLWNSNNSQVIQMVEDIQLKLKMRVLFFEKVEEDGMVINLQNLLANCGDYQLVFDEKQKANFVCNYQLNMKVQIIHQQNEKINQLIKVIQDLRVKSLQKREEGPQMSDLLDLQKRLSISFDQNDSPRNILVMCNSKSTANYVSSFLRSYQANRNYIQFLIQMTDYLTKERKFRLVKLKKIYDRNKVKADSSNADFKIVGSKKTWFEENKIILEELLFRQLTKVHELVLNFDLQLTIINQQLSSAQKIDTVFTLNEEEINIKTRFQQQLNAVEFKIINKADIKIFASIQRAEEIIFENKNTKIRVIVDHCYHGVEPAHFNQVLKYSNPHSIIFYSPSTTLLRSLYLYQLENDDANLQNIHIFSFKDSYQSKSVAYQVEKQNKAFWAISQNRSQLHQFIESPFLRIKDLNMSDSFEQARASLHSKSLIHDEGRQNTINLRSIDLSGYRRTVLVDTRQFKSSLPSHLYHCGFQVLPMFLKTADYILSDDIAIEKKSVHTKDLHNSLKGPRLDDQMRRMSQSFKSSYLLIECEEETDCNRQNFGYLDGRSGNKSRFQLRKRLMQLLHKFPNIRLLWSTSVNQSCEYIKQLKKDRPQPDELKFSKYEEEQIDESTKPLARILEESQRKQEDE